jgi:hypothetical protein
MEASMDYQIVISPGLGLPAAEFIALWNDTPACRQTAQARLADAGSASYDLDPALIQQGLIFLGGVAGGIALDLVKDLAKERLKAYLEHKLPQPPPEVKVEAVPQPDGSVLLVIHEAE